MCLIKYSEHEPLIALRPISMLLVSIGYKRVVLCMVRFILVSHVGLST